MNHTMEALVQELADETGEVQITTDAESPAPDLDVSVDIRDPEFQMFESEDGELYLKTPEMPESTFAEVVPTSEGPITQVVTEVQEMDLTECEPAARAEQPDVGVDSTEVIVD